LIKVCLYNTIFSQTIEENKINGKLKTLKKLFSSKVEMELTLSSFEVINVNTTVLKQTSGLQPALTGFVARGVGYVLSENPLRQTSC